ncbi:DUF5036 family protein [Parabacteroides bouchesdurhonensis]|uniref:DUF5036 family protein n=1 Tax=Parabacteroides bouchesdurhonensis TaxID=1936995 RepID=UPI000C82A083|nr:DUF5036 family protein [Parabacteroides bouchesdurhonensis]
MGKNILSRFLLIGFLFAGVSCSNDDVPNDPESTVSLNMLDEGHGKTWLGESDVYINDANNFYAYSCLIADVGEAGGVGVTMPPKLENLVHEVAVTPGHIYQVFDNEAVREFPSGARAVAVGAEYYRFFVVSPILVDDKSTGAIVKYVLVSPDTKELPEYGHVIGKVNYVGEQASMELPEGAECFWYGGIPEVFDVSTDDGILKMTLAKTPTEYNGVQGNYNVYVRLDDVYTSVVVQVK